MTDVRLKNLLITDGKLLSEGLPGKELGPKEWLELYEKLDEDDLIGPQAGILAACAKKIEKRNPELAA